MTKWTEDQQKAIDETGQNIIVSAGAGSGKTAVLSERVLTHIKNGINIDDLLILTFTNAAAAEMKERIRKNIAKHPELKDQLDKVDLAYITTFDAYSLSIVKKYNHLLNVSDRVTIIDDSIIKLKKRQILEEIFDTYYTEENQDFLNLISAFCLKDDKEIFEAILSLSAKMDNLYNKTEYLENYTKNNYTKEKIDGYIEEYLNILKKKIQTIKNTLQNLAHYTEPAYIEKLTNLLNPLLEATTYEEIKNNAYLGRCILPRGSSDEAKAIKKEITDLVNNVKELTKYQNEEAMKEAIIATKEYTEVITKIIIELDKKVNEFKYQNDAYEFIDIAKMAIRILEENKEVREELKNKYKEILIDEYQDTNDLQDLFVSALEDNNTYMVGDIKQSIYRFRNANPLLFKEKYDRYSAHQGGLKIDLNKNFRSREEVTKNINLIFNLIMNDSIGGANYLEDHQMVFGNDAYRTAGSENYNMEVLNYTLPEDKTFSKEEIEIFTIARDIQNKINSNYKIMDKDSRKARPITYGDFVILMDRSTAFEDYKKIFEYLNIPLSIYRDSKISDSVDIMLIKNLYNLIVSINEKRYDTMFKYSFVSIARSYLYNMSDNEILKVLTDKNFYETDIYLKCKDIASNLDSLTNVEVLNKIIDSFNFYEKIITTGEATNHIITLDSITKVASDVSNFGYSPKKFLEYLNSISNAKLDISLSLNKEDNNAVKIMTIHASKGLEYHVCYFSGLFKEFNIDELRNKFYFSSDYGIITPYIDNGPKNTILKTLLKQKYIHEEISEKLRLFYVALTRAREKMIMVGSFKPNLLSYKEDGVINEETRERYLSFNDIMNSIYDYIAPYMIDVDISSLNLTKDYNLTKQSNYKDNLKESSTFEIKEYEPNATEIKTDRFSKNVHSLHTKEEKENILLGLEMHELFEQIDFSNPDYTGVSDYKKGKIQKFISSKILDGAINLYKEYEFIYEDEKEMHGFIDLLIEYEDKYSIVDYKLKNTTDDAYIKQLNGYKKYIQSITDKPVDIYLYSIIDEELVKLN